MILYENKEILVCRKSSGIAVQSARLGEKDLVSILNNHLAEQAKLRETSGNGLSLQRRRRQLRDFRSRSRTAL